MYRLSKKGKVQFYRYLLLELFVADDEGLANIEDRLANHYLVFGNTRPFAIYHTSKLFHLEDSFFKEIK